MKVFFVITFFVFEPVFLFGQGHQSSLDIRIPYKSDIVTIDGEPSVYYELHFTNFASDSIVLHKLEVFDDIKSKIVFSADGEDLKNRFARIRVSQKDKEKILPPGSSSVIYLEFGIPGRSNAKLTHRIEFEMLNNGINKTHTIEGAITEVSKKY